MFSIGGVDTTLAEILGFVSGALCVWLVVRQHVLNFPIGIVNAIFFALVFSDARLWADMSLQVVYVVLGFFGWYAWLRFGPHRQEIGQPRPASTRVIITGIFGTAAITAILWPILRATGDSAPFWDALTTGLSLTAQAMLSFKVINNWYWWIVADVIYIPLYVSKDLYLTAGVYVIFLGLCVAGLVQWRRAIASRVEGTVGDPDLTAVRGLDPEAPLQGAAS